MPVRWETQSAKLFSGSGFAFVQAVLGGSWRLRKCFRSAVSVCIITTSVKGSKHWVGSIKSPWQVNTVSANCAVYFVKGKKHS